MKKKLNHDGERIIFPNWKQNLDIVKKGLTDPLRYMKSLINCTMYKHLHI